MQLLSSRIIQLDTSHRAVLLHLVSKFLSNITFIPAGCQVWFLGDLWLNLWLPGIRKRSRVGQWSIPVYLTKNMLLERFL